MATCLILLPLLAGSAIGEVGGAPWLALSGPDFHGWTGVKDVDGGAVLVLPGCADFRYPDGPRGFYRHGFRTLNDSTADWHDLWGIRFEVNQSDDRAVEFTVTLAAANAGTGVGKSISTVTNLSGQGWHTVTLPWSSFNFDQAGTGFLRVVKEFSISARHPEGEPAGQVIIRNACVIKAPVVAIEAAVRGKCAPKGQSVEYEVQVSNCTGEPQLVTLSQVPYGWETMETTIEPSSLQLPAGATQNVSVRVKVSDRVPPGGHEKQLILATPNGNGTAASRLELVTVSELPHPYIMHTPARWQEVRDKVKKYPWAKEAQDAFVAQADKWQVPQIAQPPDNDPDDNYGPFLFKTAVEHDLLACGYAWQLTGDKAHAEKVAEFLRRLSDPNNGYSKTLRACNQSLVQEGHFFQHAAMAYDMILDAGVLGDADREQIDATLRRFTDTIELASENGSINNWNLSEDCGAFYSSLAMQDLSRAERFFSGPSGIKDQLSHGTMDDGWWYECSISYNMWCASEFTQVALAYEPFGVSFKHEWLPANYSATVLLNAVLNGGNGVESPDPKMKGKPFGMDPSIYGPSRRPFRTIADLWNGLLPFIDYRGVMFGVNDSTEMNVTGNRAEVGGQPFELAYYVFRDPAYAAIIKLGGGKRDLLYGVPELPESTPEQFRESAFADNVGLAMLRSQTPDRPIREQIQAVLHYGTHGWAHGHYDRTNLLSLMRYGRSFYNPEMIWYGYEPFMYKFYVQTSLSHNMVVVDQKNQEATPGERRVFHTGKAMQATVVDTTARWSNPPYGGMVYDYVPVKTFEEKTWREGRSVPIPDKPPAYGTLTDFTEPILQRRLMVVTDDYVVLADYLKGDKPHTFESLFQMKGFAGLEAAKKSLLRHDAQWNPDPVRSAQFITDCTWYSADAPSVGKFESRWGEGADNSGTRALASENGVLKLDVHSLWPLSQQLMIGTAPEDHGVEKRLYYSVKGDGKSLAEGKVGAWILGQGSIDVPLNGVKRLDLETKTELAKKPTLFWAGGVIVTRDGKEIPLSSLPIKSDNVMPSAAAGQDYFGGPVKIVGVEYKDAVAAEPKEAKQSAVVHVDLTGIDAVRFKAVVGSDYPLGDESQRRKTFASRVEGTEARFMTIIEPYEHDSVIQSAVAVDANHLKVELNDGRVQEITLNNFNGDGSNISIDLKETKAGQLLRTETTADQEIGK